MKDLLKVTGVFSAETCRPFVREGYSSTVVAEITCNRRLTQFNQRFFQRIIMYFIR